MSKRALRFYGCIVLTAIFIAVFSGCGSHQQPVSELQGGRTAEVVLKVEWQRTRVIPPETTKVEVTITGDGLADPIRDTITRQQDQTSVTKRYQVPVGYKRITAEAKDSSNRVLASGVGETYLQENQQSEVAIEMTAITHRTVQLRFYRYGQPSAPEFVAFQDGDGAWQAAQGSNGVYPIDVTDPGGRYGLAVVYTEAQGGPITSVVLVLHATVDELPEILLGPDEPPISDGVTVSGTVVSNLPGDTPQLVDVALRNRLISLVPTGQGSWYYSLSGVAPGTHDLAASLFLPATETADYQAKQIFLRRGVSIVGDTTIDIDFGSTEAFAPEVRAVTPQGISAGENGFMMAQFLTEGGTAITIARQWEVVFGSSIPFSAVPTAKQVAGDIHLITLGAFSQNEQRTVTRYFKAPTDLTLVLPASFGNVVVNPTPTTPYLRPTATWEPYQDAIGYYIRYSPAGSSQAVWQVYLSANWLGAGRTYTLPDLSGVTGWNSAWALNPDLQLAWEVSAVTSNKPLSDAVNSKMRPVDGLEIRYASRRSN